jgi:drug/metabolite transporter (DMT)-like permease
LNSNSKPLVSAPTLGLICLLVTSVGWGLNWPAMKVLLAEWPPLFARGTAGLSAAILIAIAARFAGQSLRVPAGEWQRLLAAGSINVFAWMGLSTLAMRWLKVGQAALLVYTMPVWALLLAWPLLGRRPTLRGLLGLGLCAFGLLLLFSGEKVTLGPEQIAGMALALSAAVLFAFGNVALKPPALPPLASLAWQLLIGCLPMVVYGCLAEHPNVAALSNLGWLLMVYMTLVPMGLCYLTWFAAVRRLPPELASMSTLLTPVVGVTAAAATLGEPFGAKEVIAIVAALLGVGLSLGGVGKGGRR